MPCTKNLQIIFSEILFIHTVLFTTTHVECFYLSSSTNNIKLKIDTPIVFLHAQIFVQLCFDMSAVTGKYGDSRHDDNCF